MQYVQVSDMLRFQAFRKIKSWGILYILMSFPLKVN